MLRLFLVFQHIVSLLKIRHRFQCIYNLTLVTDHAQRTKQLTGEQGNKKKPYVNAIVLKRKTRQSGPSTGNPTFGSPLAAYVCSS